MLCDSALRPDHDAEFHASELLDEFPCWANDLNHAAEGTIAGAVSTAWRMGSSTESDIERSASQASAIMTGLDLVDKSDGRVWGLGPSAHTLLARTAMLDAI